MWSASPAEADRSPGSAHLKPAGVPSVAYERSRAYSHRSVSTSRAAHASSKLVQILEPAIAPTEGGGTREPAMDGQAESVGLPSACEPLAAEKLRNPLSA